MCKRPPIPIGIITTKSIREVMMKGQKILERKMMIREIMDREERLMEKELVVLL
jgi:hypothetical protein